MVAEQSTVTQPLAIRTSALTKRYNSVDTALDAVELNIACGEAVVLLGSNGSGKSTLLRCLTRLVEPTSGAIHVADTDVVSANARELRRLRKRVGVVFQQINLVDHVSVLTNVVHGNLGDSNNPRQWFGWSATSEVREQAMHCLERVRLTEFAGRRADQLSGGQRQRVALARVLMQKPDIVLADEPVAALDPRSGREVMDMLWSIVEEEGLTLVCTLHQLELARKYGKRIVGLHRGRMILDRADGNLTETDLRALYEEDHA